MVLIFDLDDTLYPEITYVQSGFSAVAETLERLNAWDRQESLALMNETLRTSGRGAVFDTLLESRGAHTRKAVRECVALYRHHKPRICLAPEAEEFLLRWPCRPYLVTDGHKVVQANKVEALSIKPYFKRVYITHRYGISHAKPSPYCFNLIRRAEHCDWKDLVYVGDNPAKDFISLNALGGTTVRVMTGEHAQTIAAPGFDGQHRIDSLSKLAALLQTLH
ncbi:MAG: HAD family hydrolase [Cyanobacteria bacterium K_DeepCast_35m_m2_023]|nr:HAD family hydrolase [Cyanobacteria bacterium K_DeepCast_35m_m2_023]